jgi:hypothetical protein
MRTRKFRKSRRGGNYSIASLGQAASNLLLPAALFYAAKRKQGKRSIRKVLRR